MAYVPDYARMANAVYDDQPHAEGWLLGPMKPSGSGLTEAFQGAMFRKGSETVFAFKGPDPSGKTTKRDVLADVKLGFGMNTVQFSRALDFVEQYAPAARGHISLCGHSLGGAIAQIVGNRLRLPFMTFNAPGVGLMSRNLGEMGVTLFTGSSGLRALGAVASAVFHPVQAVQDVGAMFYRVEGVNYRLGKDVVGCIGVHYGRVIEVPYDGGALDVLTKHSMETFLGVLEGPSFRNISLRSLVA